MFPTVLQPQEIVIFPVASRRESENVEGSQQTRLNLVNKQLVLTRKTTLYTGINCANS